MPALPAERLSIAQLLRLTFLVLVFSLPFDQHAFGFAGFLVNSTDILFLFAAAITSVGLLRGQLNLPRDRFFIVLVVYFATMLPSFDGDQVRSWAKLASQLYLINLPVLACMAIKDVNDIRATAFVWLAATTICCLIGTTTVLLFWLGVDRSALTYGLHQYGTLPPGNYPRIDATFVYAAMLGNYLTVSLIFLLIARTCGWLTRPLFSVVMVLVIVTGIFSLTPGLGGLFLALAVWEYLRLRRSKPRRARLTLFAGILSGIAFVLAATVTPIMYSTAPFVLHLPGGAEIAPAVRVLTWIDASARFLTNPIFGAGIAADAAEVQYTDPSGMPHVLTDAHNVFLNVAVQFGALGLTALVLLIAAVLKRTQRLRFAGTGLIPLGLAIAWLDAFVYQGLTGSFEDARHLWVLLGLFIASYRMAHLAEDQGLWAGAREVYRNQSDQRSIAGSSFRSRHTPLISASVPPGFRRSANSSSDSSR